MTAEFNLSEIAKALGFDEPFTVKKFFRWDLEAVANEESTAKAESQPQQKPVVDNGNQVVSVSNVKE